ncbi:YHS domain-containing protein [Candidatus Binatia bacterium]|nr:YHS domain-containing protein [Candidatus Binatia bacterium]
MGGATGALTKDALQKAHALGKAIARAGAVLITGACPGLPLAAACGAKQAGGLVVGISPGLSLDEHVRKYRSPTDFHDVLIFTGSGLMGREVVNIRSSDIVLFIGGRSGTLGELAIAYDEGKLMGLLAGTGGVSDIAEKILEACKKQTGARVVSDCDPQGLVDECLRVYREEHHHRPSCFCDDALASEADGPDPERDPVCGMPVSPASAAATRNVGGVQLYFCSEECATRFDAGAVAEAPAGS